MRDVPIRNFAALSAYRAARTARIVENLYLAGFHGVHLRVPAFRKASFLFLRQILVCSRAMTLQEPDHSATQLSPASSKLSGLETVAKPTTGQQPRAIHSTTHLLRVREDCAGLAAVRPRLTKSLTSEFEFSPAASERHRRSPRSRTARRPRGTLPPETRRVAALRG